ncbi:MAG: TetR/AcrR family transcriptional regulator [Bermanella sp.]
MSSSRYHHGDLKAALIDAANALLKEKGIEALSLRTLASMVGVSHMAPYAHFKNKTELFQAIAASGFNALAKRQEAVNTDQSAAYLILDYGTQYIEFAIENAPLYRLMLSQTQVTGPQQDMSTSNHLSDELKTASKRPYMLLMNAFALISKDKEAQNVRAQGAWAMVHGIASLLIDGHLNIPKGMSMKAFLAKASMQVLDLNEQ